MSLRNRLQRLEQAHRPRIDPALIARVRSLSPSELEARLDALDEQLIAGELAELGYPVPDRLADQRPTDYPQLRFEFWKWPTA